MTRVSVVEMEREAAAMQLRLDSGQLADDELDMMYAAYNALLWAMGYGCMPVSEWKQFKVRAV